jgi:homoserine kinase type II
LAHDVDREGRFVDALDVAAFTKPTNAELMGFLRRQGFEKCDEFQAVAGGSVNSNFRVRADGKLVFLRLYEEQRLDGARREVAMLASLRAAGVPTPRALGDVEELAGRPAVLFPWVEGQMRCQAAVSSNDTAALGHTLAELHRVKGIEAPAGRFHTDALHDRLDVIAASDRAAEFPVERLRRVLDEVERARDVSLPRGVVHGDLFRDNVLWEGNRLAALLDFESAFDGPLVYDLAVCILAWCFGEALDPDLERGLLAGYESVRPLSEQEKTGLRAEKLFGAVRFTITRITDYAMRPAEGRVMKDWRRFLSRLDAFTCS